MTSPEPLFQPSCSLLPARFGPPEIHHPVHSHPVHSKHISPVQNALIENDMISTTETSPSCLVVNELSCGKNASQLINQMIKTCRNALEHSKYDSPSHNSESPPRDRTSRMKWKNCERIKKKQLVKNVKDKTVHSSDINDSNSIICKTAVQESTKSKKIKRLYSNAAGNLSSNKLNQAAAVPVATKISAKENKEQCSCNLYDLNKKTVPKVGNEDKLVYKDGHVLAKSKRPAEDVVGRDHKIAKAIENVQKKPETDSHHLTKTSILPNAVSVSCRESVPRKYDSEPTDTLEKIAGKMPEMKNIKHSEVAVIKHTTQDIILEGETLVNNSLQTETPNERGFESIPDLLPNELEESNTTAIFNDTLQIGSTLHEEISESGQGKSEFPISKSLKNLFDFVRLNSKVNKSEVPECLEHLTAKYPHIKETPLKLFYNKSIVCNKQAKTLCLDVSGKNEIKSIETLKTAVSTCKGTEKIASSYPSIDKYFSSPEQQNILNSVPFSSTTPPTKMHISNSFFLTDAKVPKQINQEIAFDSIKGSPDSRRVCFGDASTTGLSPTMANKPNSSPSTTNEVEVVAIKTEPTSDPMKFTFSNKSFINSSKNLQSLTVIPPSPVPHPPVSAEPAEWQPQFCPSSESVCKNLLLPPPGFHLPVVSVKLAEAQPQITSSLESSSKRVISLSPDFPVVSSKPAESKFSSSSERAIYPSITPMSMKNTKVLPGPGSNFSNQLPNSKEIRSYQPFIECATSVVQKHSSQNYNPVVFPDRKGNQMSSNGLHKYIGKSYIGISDFSSLIIEWNPLWFEIQKETKKCAPISDVYLHVKDTYENELDYYNTYFPLHLLNTWLKLSESWMNNPIIFDSVFDCQEEKPNFVKITCSTVLSFALFTRWPRREDVLVCTTMKPDGSQRGLFGRICNVMAKDYAPPTNSSGLQDKIGTLKMVRFEFFCAERLEAHHQDTVRIQILLNIRIALLQNDALQNLNQAMKDLILDPKRHRSQVRFIPLQSKDQPAFENCIGDIIDSATSPDIRVTIVDTPTPCDLLSVISHLAIGLVKKDRPVLIGLRNLDMLIKLASILRLLCNIVLAVKKKEVKLPDELNKFTIEERMAIVSLSDRTFEKCPLTLTLLSNIFMGDLSNMLTDQNLTCIVHEAHLCTETETSLLLYYNVEHLVLMGKNEDSAALHSILKHFGYHVSLFSRFSRTRR